MSEVMSLKLPLPTPNVWTIAQKFAIRKSPPQNNASLPRVTPALDDCWNEWSFSYSLLYTINLNFQPQSINRTFQIWSRIFARFYLVQSHMSDIRLLGRRFREESLGVCQCPSDRVSMIIRCLVVRTCVYGEMYWLQIDSLRDKRLQHLAVLQSFCLPQIAQ